MIRLTKTNGEEILLPNRALLYVEIKKETVLVLQNGTKLLVKESSEEIQEKFLAHERLVIAGKFKMNSEGAGYNGENFITD